MRHVFTLLILLTCFVYNLSSAFFYLFFIFLFFFVKKKDNLKLVINIFNITILFSLLLTLYSEISSTDLSFTFLASDQADFVEKAKLYYQNKSFSNLLNQSIALSINSAMGVSYFLFGFVAFVTGKITEIFTIFNLQILIAFFTSIICLEFKKIAEYLLETCLNKYVYFFLIGSPLLFCSTLILRDLFVLYLYFLSFSTFLNHKNLFYKIVTIIICSLVLYSIRFESGVILLLLIPLLFINSKKVLTVSFIISISLVFFIIPIFFKFAQGSEELLNEINSNQSDRILKSGLISRLYSLPSPLNFILVGFFFLLWPFPFYALMIEPYDFIPLFYMLFTSYFMIRNMYFLFFSIPFFKKIDTKFLSLLLFSILLIFVNILFEIQIRRILPSIGILFILGFFINEKRILKGKSKKDNYSIFFIFIFLHLLYFYFKFL